MFPQFLQMVPLYLDVVVPLLIMQQQVKYKYLKAQMEFWCDEGRTLLYHQPFQLLLC